MKQLRFWFVLVCTAVAPVSWAALIGISNTQALAFGTFAAGSGGGSVTVSAGGVRTPSGGVVLVSSGAGAAATFTVSGDPVTYAINLPGDGTVTLTSGANSMAVGTFTSSPSGTGTLASGSQTLSVGATLSVGSNQAAGVYTGSFDVTVDYN